MKWKHRLWVSYMRMEASLLRRWEQARAETDRLFAAVRREFLYERPIAERHRLIFYVGHLEAFDWNLICGERRAFHPAFNRLFAFGIDPVGTGLPTDQPSDWPQESEIRAYGQRVRETLNAMDVSDLLLNVAIEHRLMHAETLAYLVHQLPHEMKCRPRGSVQTLSSPFAAASWSNSPSDSPRPGGSISGGAMVLVPSGEVTLGQPDRNAFGWDNEFDGHTARVGAFEMDRFKVSNGDYLAFVEDGGDAPAFWVRHGDRWFYRAMFEEIPLPLDWPVYVSQRNAAAYAGWVDKALPTEAEWQHAASGACASANTNFHSWDPQPVQAAMQGESVHGIVEMRGNGWEWTSTAFAPFPGFRPFDFYPGYSANFFDGKHYVMLGGSMRTAECMMRPTFRNWFQPDYPYVYSGFRCVRHS